MLWNVRRHLFVGASFCVSAKARSRKVLYTCRSPVIGLVDYNQRESNTHLKDAIPSLHESFPRKRKWRPTHDSAHYGECWTHTLKHQDLKTLAPKTSWTHSRSFDLKPKGMNFWPNISFHSTKQLWVLWSREWLSSILVWMPLKWGTYLYNFFFLGSTKFSYFRKGEGRIS